MNRIFAALGLLLLMACQNEGTLLYVGTYSNNGSEGIYRYAFNNETGDLTGLSVTPNQQNPSFLAFSEGQKFLYAVSEQQGKERPDKGGVEAFRVKRNGELEPINRELSEGDHPCHVCVSPDGRFVVASNYTSGSLSFFPVLHNGRLSPVSQQILHIGSGPDSTRQRGPHAHSALFSPDGERLFAADLGTDKLYVYQQIEGEKKFEPAKVPFVDMEPGAGPRHFCFSPDGKFIYVMNEMHSTVTVIKNDGAYGILQTISSLPEGFTGHNQSADIHCSANGRFLYCSNRGHNSIAVFERNSQEGKIKLVENEPVQGNWPRNFAISPKGNFLLVANQNSNNITVFSIDPLLGELHFTGKDYPLPNPVCLLFKD